VAKAVRVTSSGSAVYSYRGILMRPIAVVTVKRRRGMFTARDKGKAKNLTSLLRF
jgi:hypothetical protein